MLKNKRPARYSPTTLRLVKQIAAMESIKEVKDLMAEYKINLRHVEKQISVTQDVIEAWETLGELWREHIEDRLDTLTNTPAKEYGQSAYDRKGRNMQGGSILRQEMRTKKYKHLKVLYQALMKGPDMLACPDEDVLERQEYEQAQYARLIGACEDRLFLLGRETKARTKMPADLSTMASADIALKVLLPILEAELTRFADTPEYKTTFLAVCSNGLYVNCEVSGTSSPVSVWLTKERSGCAWSGMDRHIMHELVGDARIAWRWSNYDHAWRKE